MTRLISTTEKTVTDPRAKRMLDLWNDGNDTYDIARIMKIHESEVYNHLAYLNEQKTEPYSYPRDAAQDRFFSRGGWI